MNPILGYLSYDDCGISDLLYNVLFVRIIFFDIKAIPKMSDLHLRRPVWHPR